jgi:RimJ/RimL family protein N-acetyltransferase
LQNLIINNMNERPGYLFCSERLGFRNWTEDDLLPMAAINADPEVMEFFPATVSVEQTKAFIMRMQRQYAAKGYCYFAIDRLDTGMFIGFTGLCDQVYEADFTPCVDIGWRLDKAAWHKGYATEAARRCLEFAFTDRKIDCVFAVAPVANGRSEQVMQRVGMIWAGNFVHPALLDYERLKACVVYRATSAGQIS